MFSIDLVTFFYKYPNCITVTTYQKSEPARTFENENCVCVRDHDDVWFIEKNDVKRTRWWTNMDTTSKIKSKKYYLLCFYVLFQMLFLSKRKNISVIDMYSMKLNVKEYLWHWIWHACMTCFIRWLHFGKANIIHNLYLYMWFVMQISSKFARFRKQKRDSHKWNSRRCNF